MSSSGLNVVIVVECDVGLVCRRSIIYLIWLWFVLL